MKKIMILCVALLTLVALTACKSNSEEPSVSDSTVADNSNLYTWINTRDTMRQVPTTNIIKSNFSGLFQVKLGGKHGFVDSTMMVVIPCVYDDMLDFCGTLCGVLVGDKWGFIDTEGKMVIEPKYDWVSSFNEDKAAVVYNGDTLYIWENGEYLDTNYYFSFFEN